MTKMRLLVLGVFEKNTKVSERKARKNKERYVVTATVS